MTVLRTGSVLDVHLVSFAGKPVFLAGAFFLRIKLKIVEMNTVTSEIWLTFLSNPTVLKQTANRARPPGVWKHHWC